MPNYKLNYFNIRGRGEFTRLVFTAAGVPFVDNRIELEDWPAQKSRAPLGQLPYLEVDGVSIPQSLAIARFVAREHGLDGKTALQKAQADAVVDCVNDLANAFYRSIKSMDPDELQKAAIDFFNSEEAFKLDTRIDTAVTLYGQNGFAAGDSLTWADLVIFELIHPVFEDFPQQAPIFEQKYPNMTAVYHHIKTIPKIAEYAKNRPKTLL